MECHFPLCALGGYLNKGWHHIHCHHFSSFYITWIYLGKLCLCWGLCAIAHAWKAWLRTARHLYNTARRAKLINKSLQWANRWSVSLHLCSSKDVTGH